MLHVNKAQAKPQSFDEVSDDVQGIPAEYVDTFSRKIRFNEELNSFKRLAYFLDTNYLHAGNATFRNISFRYNRASETMFSRFS